MTFTTILLNGWGATLRQREQTLRPCIPASRAFGVIPTHGQAALGTPPTLFFVLDPFLDAHLTHLRKVRQVLTTVQKTDIDQVRNAVAGQLITVSTASIIQSVRRAYPDRAVAAMGRKLAATETTVAAKAIHPTRIRDRLEFIRRFG